MKDGYYRTIFPNEEELIQKIQNNLDDTNNDVDEEVARGVVFIEVLVITPEQYNHDIQAAIEGAFERGYLVGRSSKNDEVVEGS